MDKKNTFDKKILIVILLIIALVSGFGLSRFASSPKMHAGVLRALEEKGKTVEKLTATSAAASVAIAALPGDASTPIADQVADISSFLLLIVAAIMLEKAMITVFGFAAFGILIPLACLLGILYLFVPQKMIKSIAIRSVLFGLVLYISIPLSVEIGKIVDKTLNTNVTIENVVAAAEDIQEETGSEEKGFIQHITELGDTIVNGVSDSISEMSLALKKLMDAVAAMLITACAIPLLVFWILLWFVKTTFSGLLQ